MNHQVLSVEVNALMMLTYELLINASPDDARNKRVAMAYADRRYTAFLECMADACQNLYAAHKNLNPDESDNDGG